MARRKKQSHAWVYVIWGVNGIGVLCLLVAGLFYFNKQGASAANAVFGETATPGIVQQGAPTSYFLPTLTPNPFYTPPVFETSTPFVLANGVIPGAVGLSAAGRPIELYTFGNGDREYLIVAGIHGGYDLGRDYPELTNHMLVCVTEMNTREQIDALVEGLAWAGRDEAFSEDGISMVGDRAQNASPLLRDGGEVQR